MSTLELVDADSREQGMFPVADSDEPAFSDTEAWFQASPKDIQISVRYGLPRTEGTVRSYSRPTVAIPCSTATGEPRLTYTLTGRAS